MPYREYKGNLFASRAQCLVNTVNCVGVMGKGVALEFRRRFPSMFQEYRRICEAGTLRPGQILPYRKWRKILEKYNAPYFHYREFRLNANTKPEDPYYGWPDEKRREFLFELAMIVGESAVPTGSVYPTAHNQKIGINNKPFDATIHAFFNAVRVSLDRHWPEYNGRVHFIFDEIRNKREWTGPLVEIHQKFRDRDDRIGSLSFGDDKKDPENIALQAADLSAIRLREETKNYLAAGGGIFDMTILDFIISKNDDPFFRKIPKVRMEKMINDMRYDEALQRRHGFTGTYIPIKHFPFEKYGYKKYR